MPYAYGFCPNCGVKYNVRASSIGTVKRCEACGTKFIVPAPAPSPPSASGCGTCLVVMLATVGLGVVLVCAGVGFLGLNANPVPQARNPPAPIAQFPEEPRAPLPVGIKQKSPSFKLAELCGLNIDEIRKALGHPIGGESEPTDLQKSVGIEEWNDTFKQGDDELLVTFNSRTRQVTDFFIAGDDFDRIVSDWQLDRNTTKYRLEPVKALAEPRKITGVMVIPIGVQHTSSTAQATETRTWHDSSGKFQTEAQFVSLTAGVVTLRKTGGTTVKVPLEKLSEEDREWIAARRKGRPH